MYFHFMQKSFFLLGFHFFLVEADAAEKEKSEIELQCCVRIFLLISLFAQKYRTFIYGYWCPKSSVCIFLERYDA